jgi:SAM-dependent MidA family methyltransferase
MGEPDPFVVVEAGAGPGTLARSVLAAGAECGAALQLVLVERAEVQWATHPPGVTSRADLPGPGELGPGPAVVLANELLDNLPFGLVERTARGWSEVRVGRGPEGGGPALVEVLVPLDPDRARWCEARVGPGAVAPGSRIPVQADAAHWLGTALGVAGAGGRVVVLDYAADSADLARRPWREWVRTYAGHGRAGEPLDDPGSRDITCEVAVDQLALVRPPSRDRSQAEFLRAADLAELVEEGRRIWAERGPAADLAAIAGRSRVHEAEALTDPTGLGAFRVLEWDVPPLG